MTKTLVFDRFRPDSIGGRILTTLSDGQPKSIAQIARVAKPRSVRNITAPGGWYTQLRAYGKASRKFTLSKTDDGKLVLMAKGGTR